MSMLLQDVWIILEDMILYRIHINKVVPQNVSQVGPHI